MNQKRVFVEPLLCEQMSLADGTLVQCISGQLCDA